MQKRITPIVCALAVITIISCNEKKEDDITDTVNKAGAVETAVHINHLDGSSDELITTHTIWVKHNQFKKVEYRDTIPSLGIENTVAENEEGDTKNVSVPKEYEIYITVK